MPIPRGTKVYLQSRCHSGNQEGALVLVMNGKAWHASTITGGIDSVRIMNERNYLEWAANKIHGTSFAELTVLRRYPI